MHKLSRRKPVNISDEHIYLFEHEFNTDLALPTVDLIKWPYVDLYWYTALTRINSITKRKLQYKKMPLRRIFSPKIIFCRETALVFDEWSENYFHWITEVIPRLQQLDNLKKNILILVPSRLYQKPFVLFTLSLFNNLLFKSLSVNVSTKFIFRRAYLVDLKMNSGNYHPCVLKRVVNLFDKHLTKQSRSKEKRLFICRNSKTGRVIENFHEISPILAKYNFYIIDFEKLKIEQQILLMKSSHMLIGVHGAGLTNMIFLPKGSIVVELRRCDDKNNNCYFSLASIFEHDYYYQLCAVDNYTKPTQQNNFIVDPSSFKNLLSYILD